MKVKRTLLVLIVGVVLSSSAQAQSGGWRTVVRPSAVDALTCLHKVSLIPALSAPVAGTPFPGSSHSSLQFNSYLMTASRGTSTGEIQLTAALSRLDVAMLQAGMSGRVTALGELDKILKVVVPAGPSTSNAQRQVFVELTPTNRFNATATNYRVDEAQLLARGTALLLEQYCPDTNSTSVPLPGGDMPAAATISRESNGTTRITGSFAPPSVQKVVVLVPAFGVILQAFNPRGCVYEGPPGGSWNSLCVDSSSGPYSGNFRVSGYLEPGAQLKPTTVIIESWGSTGPQDFGPSKLLARTIIKATPE